uniref:RNA-directed DNA polymerase n=1 Tax=Ixodes ricinus TaxID=34613 RepID=A0A147BIU1_IXORI
MGDKAEDILLSFSLTADQMTHYEVVHKAFDDHFIGRRNLIYDRSKFHTRIQEDGEPVEHFVTDLHALAQYCKFGTLHDEMIRDRIVVGVRDRKLSEKMQLDANLTLETATTMARQSETVKRQQTDLRPESDSVSRVKASYPSEAYPSEARPSQRRLPTQTTKSVDDRLHCLGCGYNRHARSECPAKAAICHRCGKRGHFAKVCLGAKAVQELIAEEEDPSFLGTVDAKDTDPWTVTVELQRVPLSFKVDTGADVTVIPETVYLQHFEQVSLTEPTKLLRGPGQDRLRVVGVLRGDIMYKTNKVATDVYVLKNLESPLLSRRDSEKLGVVKRLNEVSTSNSNTVNAKAEFPSLFTGLGCVNMPYTIRLNQDAVPFSLASPRRIPIPLMQEVKKELENMVLLDVIEPVDEPTDWCSAMVVVRKPNGSYRICVDFTSLNKYVERELHPLPTTDHVLAQLGNARFFSKLDANSGFWQFKLAPESQILTTFITPFGRYKFKRLPFGITSAPEFYQKKMSQLLSDIEGHVCNMDDILVYGSSKEEHNKRLREVLARLQQAGITLNDSKCVFEATQVKFLGHIIDQTGVHPDDDKLAAVRAMKTPANVSELKSFLGMINYLGKFIPHLAQKAHPLTALLSSKNAWVWDCEQQMAFDALKVTLTSTPILALFDPKKITVISADASSYGIGAVLRQKQSDDTYRPVAYASRTLSNTERRYAQIEKEGLAVVWSCEKFRDLITGLEVIIETDHKPLVPIFSTKSLEDIPLRLQRMKLRMMRYSYDIRHVPGKDLIAADVLSRHPLAEVPSRELEEEIDAYVHGIKSSLPATDKRLQQIQEEQEKDVTCQLLTRYCAEGWPIKNNVDQMCKDFWQYRTDISMNEGLLMKGSRILVPQSMREDILSKIHHGHQGITKCRARARESVWWPGISTQIENFVRGCYQCIQETSNRREPLMPTPFPERPWQQVGMDLFYLAGKWYLLVTDYYSRFPEVAPLTSLSTTSVIDHLKSIFARHGTPETVFSDNGPQFQKIDSSEFFKFSQDWGFHHKTSSPKFPQSNGFVESAVKIIKRSMKKTDDVYRALQSYRATPLENGYSPAELLMGRRIRTSLPTVGSRLNPKTPYPDLLKNWEKQSRDKEKVNFDRRHGVHALKPLHIGQRVWVSDQRQTGHVTSPSEAPRSYMVETDRGVVRRNRGHLIPIPIPTTHAQSAREGSPLATNNMASLPTTSTASLPTTSTGLPTTWSGRTVKPVDRLGL